MEVIKTSLSDVLILKPAIYEDSRGYFFETFNRKTFRTIGLDVEFKQDNQSKSQKGVLRGLHFQCPPFAQGKLVRVIQGGVLDVAVDLRRNSPYYGKHHKTILSESNKLMFWIPPGFAHGFLTLENDTIFTYKCTEIYNKQSEGVIMWNDPDLNIDWGTDQPILSDRDLQGVLFRDFSSDF